MAIKTLQLHCGAAGFPFGQRVFMPNSQLSIDSDKRIINAALIFTLKEKTAAANQYMVMVTYDNGTTQIIDKVNPTVNSKFSVNVTEEVICGVNNPNDDIFITLSPDLVVEDDVILAIEYVSEHLMVGETATIDIDAHKAGGGKICLATGKLRFNRGFGATGVALTYNDSETNNSQQSRNHHCGNGWKLNLEQSLVKTVDEQDREVYTYVDGQGNYHEFSEKYYYVIGDVKRFIDKEAVNVDLDGKLTTFTDDGSIADVKLELRSTAGLTLETDYAKFNGG